MVNGILAHSDELIPSIWVCTFVRNPLLNTASGMVRFEMPGP